MNWRPLGTGEDICTHNVHLYRVRPYQQFSKCYALHLKPANCVYIVKFHDFIKNEMDRKCNGYTFKIVHFIHIRFE